MSGCYIIEWYLILGELLMDDYDKTIAPSRAHKSSFGDDVTVPGKRPRRNDGRFGVSDLIMGRYKVLAELGQGGMGVVYKCFDEIAGIEVALKALPPELSHNTLEMDDIKENFQLVHNLHHPNIASSNNLERDDSNGNYYLIMECCEGEDLRQWIKKKRKEGGLKLEEVLSVIQQVADALDYAHSQKIIHRDIKPGNIMISAAGDIKVLDFGLAAQIHSSMSRVSVAYHGTSGTGPYMAPEQWCGRAQGAPADQYALAVMTYEMLAGRLPFESSDPAVLQQAALTQKAEAITGIPRAVQNAIDRAMSKDAAARFASCSDFAAAMTGKKIRAAKVQKRGAAFKWMTTFLILLMLGAGGTGYYFFDKHLKRIEIETLLAEVLDAREKSQWKKVLESAEKILALDAKIVEAKKLKDIAVLFVEAYGAREKSQWKKVLESAEKILALDAQNSEAEKLKDEAKKKILGPPPPPPVKEELRKMTVSGIAGTKLELQYPDGKKAFFTIPEKGIIVIEKLKRGAYFLRGSHPEYLLSEKRLVLDDDLLVNVKMEKIFKKFSVTTLPGSKVELLQNSQVKFTQKTDAKGMNVFSKVKSGVYELKISAPHYKSHSTILYIEKDTALTIPLEKLFYNITVYGKSGIRGELFAGTQRVRRFVILPSGYVTINDVEPGKYVLNFTGKGYVPEKRSVEVTGNTSLEIDLKPNPDPEPHTGTLNVYLSASGKLLEFIQQKGIEIKIDDGSWIKTKVFPFTRKVNAGKVSLSIRGEGIIPQNNLSRQIFEEQNTDFLLDIKAQPSKIVFASNRADAKFAVESSVYSVGEEFSIDPFREYFVTSSSQGQSLEKSVKSTRPGEKLKVHFTFQNKVHPMQGKYEQGMKLFKQEKYKEALPLLLSAAETGHLDAVLQVALMYEKGLGMWFSDNKKALQWYFKAAKLKNTAAAIKVADAIYDGDYNATARQMLDFYLLAVKISDPKAIYKVARIYKNGFKEIPADDGKSLEYLQMAADLGMVEAMYDLGIRYDKGQGVPFNSQKALFWIRKAANAGYEPANKFLEASQL